MDSKDLEKYFDGIYIPLDCQFIVAHPTEQNAVIFTEVYHIRRNDRLQMLKLGEWDHENGHSWANASFYSRRSDLQGVTINAAVISDVSFDRRSDQLHGTGSSLKKMMLVQPVNTFPCLMKSKDC